MFSNDNGVRILSRSPVVNAMADGMAAKFAGRAVAVARRQMEAAQDQASMATWRSILMRLEHLDR